MLDLILHTTPTSHFPEAVAGSFFSDCSLSARVNEVRMWLHRKAEFLQFRFR